MIDFHISFRSSAYFQALATQSPADFSPEEALARLDSKRELPARSTDEHLADWLATLDTHGISHAVTLAASEAEISVLAEAAQKSDGRLIPIAPFNPTGEKAIERVEHLLGATGFRGLVLDPGSDHYLVSEDRFAEVFEAIESHDGIVFLRCGIPELRLRRAFGLPIQFDPDAANPLHLLVAAHRSPGLKFVVPNFGGGFFRELLLVGKECPNIWVDSSAPDDWMKAQAPPLGLADVLESSLSIFGIERVLFGTASSDPRAGWNHKILTRQREAFGACSLSPDQCEQLLGGNARQLLGLPMPARRPVSHPY